MPFWPPMRYDPFAILVLALVLDALIGDPPRVWRHMPHPVRGMGNVIRWLERRLSRPEAGAAAQRWRGALACFAALLVNAAIGGFLAWALLQTTLAFVIEALIVAVMLAGRDLYDHVARVADGLERSGLAGGREAVSHVVGRDPESLDGPGVARAAIESLAEGFCDGVVAPAFWYAVFGLPGLFAYKALNTADSMIGHISERHRDFGRATARLDDLANWLPARLAGMLIVGAACLVQGARPGAAYAAMKRDAPQHRSPNAGWTEAAIAGALGLALAGPRRYQGQVVEDAWMGDGRREATAADIRRALLLYLHTAGLFAAVMLICAWLNR